MDQGVCEKECSMPLILRNTISSLSSGEGVPPSPVSITSIMMQKLTIERVSGHNIADFLFLLTELALYEHLTPPDADTRLRLTRDILMYPPPFEAYIGKCGNRSVGCVTFFLTYSTFIARPTLFIEDLFVLSDFRGQGFGRALFSFCKNIAMVRGCGRMDWMVLSWNEPSIRFYEKVGGKRIGWDVYRLEGTGE